MSAKWATMIPLIGGSAIGCSMATKNKPEYHLSFEAFGNNESHLQNYWQDIEFKLLDEQEIPKDRLDFVNSVCPCAGLSQLSTKKDPSKNEWMLKTARMVLENMKPRVFWGENAPALYTASGKFVRTELAKIAAEYGYSFSVYKTSTSHHGIPQRRHRTFYFFWDSPTAPEMRYYDRDTKPFHEYIMDIPETASMQDKINLPDVFEYSPTYSYILDHFGMTHREHVAKHADTPRYRSVSTFLLYQGENAYTGKMDGKYGMLPDAIKWLEENHPGHYEIRNFNHAINKMSQGKGYMESSPLFYNTQTTAIVGRNLYNAIHPHEPRSLSHRELFHMMGMPHDFEMVRDHINDVAQNVPTVTARDMTLEVLAYLNGDLEDSGHQIVKQNNFHNRVDLAGDVSALIDEK